MIPKLLVIEDDELMAQLTVSIGKDAGFAVALASGENAAASCAQLAPDLIILDILMPAMDGFEVLQLLKESGNRARIILVSGSDNYRRMAENLARGSLNIVGNIAKPFDIMEMHRMLSGIRQELTARESAA